MWWNVITWVSKKVKSEEGIVALATIGVCYMLLIAAMITQVIGVISGGRVIGSVSIVLYAVALSVGTLTLRGAVKNLGSPEDHDYMEPYLKER